ncbi:MAG: ASKHA domain-containing protein [Spirochaetes bacterium]|nr:ASKHA domain-containing protein [Spirochaetota bacterium]
METQRGITIHATQDGKEHFGEYGNSFSLLDYLSKHTPFTLQAPCGGKGRCGKCKIRIIGGTPSPVTDTERTLLHPDELSAGIRLACMVNPETDLSISLEGEKKVQGNKSFRFSHPLPVDGSLHTLVLELVPPSLEDQRSDHSRLLSALATEGLEVPTPLLLDLPQVLREGKWRVTLIAQKNRVLSILPSTLVEGQSSNPASRIFGVAVDIGTTTVAAYLFDLYTGVHIDSQSELNAQGAFGGDVISRIQYALESLSNLRRLQEKILTQIDELIHRMAIRTGIHPAQICMACIVGNPTMIHLTLGLNPKYIAEAPFIPVTTEPLFVPTHELGLSLSAGGIVRIPPAVSAYVGSDILAGVIASGMATSTMRSALLIDIGTNGEIVLGIGDRFIACSTAAGPAFEGAQITCGMGGVAGAIDGVIRRNLPVLAEGLQGPDSTPCPTHPLSFTTILDAPPVGFCGAGIVDLLAILLETGMVDETGRMLSQEEGKRQGHPLAEWLITYDDEPAFLLVPADKSGTGMPILLTQQDVREIQLAKAAIAAGIRTLLQKANLTFDEIRTLYLAGGFGNYLNPRSAIRIGLIPKELEGKIQSIGNASGLGASLALLSEKTFSLFQQVRERTSYIELSSSPEFQELYVEEMMFPS